MGKILLKTVFPVLLAECLQNKIFLKVFQEILNSLRSSSEMKLVNAIKTSLIHFHILNHFVIIISLIHHSCFFPLYLFFYHYLLVTLIGKSTFAVH